MQGLDFNAQSHCEITAANRNARFPSAFAASRWLKSRPGNDFRLDEAPFDGPRKVVLGEPAALILPT